MTNNDLHGVMATVVAVVFLLAVAAVSAFPWHDDADAHRVLLAQGYSEIEIKPGGWFACGAGDLTKTPFEAVGPAGTKVSGVVCCGIIKSCTVRL